MEINQIQCFAHKRPHENLCTDIQYQNALLCSRCATRDKIDRKHLILIDDLFDESNILLSNWPLTEETDLIEQIEKIPIQSNSPSDQMARSKIENYFKSLRSSIIHEIDQIQANMFKKLDCIENAGLAVRQEYKQMCRKNDIQRIIECSNMTLEMKNQQLKQIFLEVFQNQAKNKKALEQAIKNIKQSKQNANFTIPDQISNEIVGLIAQIDMFKDKDFNEINDDIVFQITNSDQNEEKETIKRKLREEIERNRLLGDSLSNMTFIPTEFEDSSNLQITHPEVGICSIKQSNSLIGTVVTSSILDNNSAYIFRFVFNKPLKNYGFFHIGLIEESQINSALPNDGFNGFCTNKVLGKKVLKGKNMCSLAKQFSCIEVRVCVATKQHYFADYPSYNNINAVNTESDYYNELDQSKQYRLGLGFCNIGEEWEVNLKEVIKMNEREQLTVFNPLN